MTKAASLFNIASSFSIVIIMCISNSTGEVRNYLVAESYTIFFVPIYFVVNKLSTAFVSHTEGISYHGQRSLTDCKLRGMADFFSEIRSAVRPGQRVECVSSSSNK